MSMKKAEGIPLAGDFEIFFMYFIVVAVSTVLLANAFGSSSLSPERDIVDSVSLEEKLELSSSEVVAGIEKTVRENVEVEDLSDINWSSDAEKRYYPFVIKNSKLYDVDPLLVKAVIMAESGFNPNAVSHVGAQGLMQLMPKTARYLGVEDSFNPEHNIAGGVKYLKKLLDRFDGDVRLALAAYNAGSRNVRKYRGVPPYAETRNYIKKVSHLLSGYKKMESDSGKNSLLSQI